VTVTEKLTIEVEAEVVAVWVAVVLVVGVLVVGVLVVGALLGVSHGVKPLR